MMGVPRYLFTCLAAFGTAWLALAPSAPCGEKVPKGLVYRPRGGGPLAERAEVGLVIKASTPLGTSVNIVEVDGAKTYGRPGHIDLKAPSELTYLELAPGAHQLVVTVGDPSRSGPGGAYRISKPFAVAATVEAGKEYVLWGDVFPTGSKAGVSSFDEYAISDYSGRLAQPGGPGPSVEKWKTRCDKARQEIRRLLDEYWAHCEAMPQLRLAP